MTEIPTNFKLIKLIKKPSSAEKCNLMKIFEAAIKGDPLEVDDTELTRIIENDLSISLSRLDKRLIKVLHEALIYYMTVWSGWQSNTEQGENDTQFKERYEKYRMYLMYKCNFVIKSASKYIIPSTESNDAGTQTVEEITYQKIAPYSLHIGGPPKVLNNIVFIERNGNVIVKQHSEKAWDDLEVQQFLNWPYITVEVNLPDVVLSRKVSHDYERYVGLKGETMLFPGINQIVHVSKLEPDVELQPYTHNYISCYFNQLIKVLDQLPLINKERTVLLRQILIQFLSDISEINLYNRTMSSNSSIGFHIGNCRYLRNKKMVRNSSKRSGNNRTINFYEILNPKVEISLNRFDVEQDLSSNVQPNTVSYKSLQQLLLKYSLNKNDKDVLEICSIVNEKCLTFGCCLCHVRFNGLQAYEHIYKHYKLNHKYEQSVLCYKCGLQFELKLLAGKRWSHICRTTK